MRYESVSSSPKWQCQGLSTYEYSSERQVANRRMSCLLNQHDEHPRIPTHINRIVLDEVQILHRQASILLDLTYEITTQRGEFVDTQTKDCIFLQDACKTSWKNTVPDIMFNWWYDAYELKSIWWSYRHRRRNPAPAHRAGHITFPSSCCFEFPPQLMQWPKCLSGHCHINCGGKYFLQSGQPHLSSARYLGAVRISSHANQTAQASFVSRHWIKLGNSMRMLQQVAWASKYAPSM